MKKAAWMFALALGAAPLASLPAAAQTTGQAAPKANRFDAYLVPAERFESGPLLVERHGGKGRPLILIPGLASGPWVWQETIRQLLDKPGEFSIYVLTLPGFDGRPPLAEAPFQTTRAALRDLIAQRKLDQPVLIGHSLGATLSFAVAEDLGSRIGGVVALDGLPVFPGTEELAPPQRRQMAENIRTRMAGSPPAAFADQQRQYMRSQGVLDIGKADDIAPLLLRSDREAVGAWMADLLALDLRPGLDSITAPVLVMAPFYQYDVPQGPQAAMTADDKLAHYRSLLDGVKQLEVVPIAPARHFLMIDQPLALAGALRRFLDRR